MTTRRRLLAAMAAGAIGQPAMVFAADKGPSSRLPVEGAFLSLAEANA